MWYEMDSGNAINGNQLGEEEWETERDTYAAFSVPFRAPAGFPVDFFPSRSGVWR